MLFIKIIFLYKYVTPVSFAFNIYNFLKFFPKCLILEYLIFPINFFFEGRGGRKGLLIFLFLFCIFNTYEFIKYFAFK